MDNKPIRALQLADDLALIAESEDDLNRLLARWASYCDRTHQETQTRKTEVVVFTNETDPHLTLHENELRFGEHSHLAFVYKSTVLNVVESFVYLGVLLHWRLGPQSTLNFREEKGWKVLGGMQSALRLVPFLPFERCVEIGEAVVGGAYLYSSEFWAPYLDQRATRCSRGYLSWILGLSKVRSDKLIGWFPLRDLDVKAAASLLRMFVDADVHGGLLRAAVRQLHSNFVLSRHKRRESWWSCALILIRRTWPNFDVAVVPRIGLSGIPATLGGHVLVQQQYVADTFVQRWQARQRAILNAKPTIYQQDYILYQMLQLTGILTEPIFNIIPAADVGAVRAMVRMIAGVEDYARINAHYSRRHYFPSLDGAHAKRCCLHCFCNRGVRMLDSEWHAVFDCPLHVAARSRFRLASGVTLS